MRFELWRIFAAISLLAASLACFMAFLSDHQEFVVLGPILFLAGVGTPFKKGVVLALGSPLIVLLLVMLYSIVQSWLRALS